MSSPARATGKDIILDIVENMRAYQEELLYSSIVPTAFEVHLHGDDYDRLLGILPTIAAEARRALDQELARQNRRIGPEWWQKLTNPAAPAHAAEGGWSISFFRDENDELKPGDVVIDSRLSMPPSAELGSGTRTRRITTTRIGQQVSTTTQVSEALSEGPATTSQALGRATIAAREGIDPLSVAATDEATPDMRQDEGTVRTSLPPVFATLSYEDRTGRHTHPVTRPQIVIGRGGAGYWVDLRIDAAPDVSREHVRLRRDAATGQFFLKDVSLYGTTVNGQRVASSIDTSDGAKRDINLEIPLPPVARIGLADMVFLEFRAGNGP